MTTSYIGPAYMKTRYGEVTLASVLSYTTNAPPYDFTNPQIADALDRAILAASGNADAYLGRRLTPAEVQAAADGGEALRSAVAAIAFYQCMPNTEAVSEKARADHKDAVMLLKEMGKGEVASAGVTDPQPPPSAFAPGLPAYFSQGLQGIGKL